ncbi:hypothetical protein QFC21_003378 [Naganishia friedmannii]|uniref:Uncharacterized protein n=1 Tax=Naganishia friedmannii TaxID=89922 RepID=A0ACC2VQJ5_9TREE|nr:hypothetical protein QFC21_003378 [Naganishia friedmannii]
MSEPRPAMEEGNISPAPDAVNQRSGAAASSSFQPQPRRHSSDVTDMTSNRGIIQRPNQNLTANTASLNHGDIGIAAPAPSQVLSGATSTLPAATSDFASQSQHAPFGLPRPPSLQPNAQRNENPPQQPQSVHEGVIHSILEGLFGPMMNPQPAGNGAAATATNASRPEPPLSSTPGGSTIGQNSMGNGNQRPGNPDIGTMFSMFGFPPDMMPSQSDANAQGSSVNQSTPASGTQTHSANASIDQPPPPPQPSRFSSSFSFTFDLGPFDIPGPAGPSTEVSRQSHQAASNRSMSSIPGEAGPTGRNEAGAPASNIGPTSSNQTSDSVPNARVQQPPLAFVVGPDGSWMLPQAPGAGAAAGAEGNAESRPTGGNGQQSTPVHFHFPGGSVTAEGNPGATPPLFQLFSQLFPNGVHPVVIGPGMMNFAFGPQSFMQTRLPPDPERAEELLRGLKDPGMDMMMRLDRVIRADYSQGMNVDGAPQSDGGVGDVEGWKCAVCMETFEDELDEHRQQETADATSPQPSSTRTNEVGRNPSISSDIDMHDVEMVLSGETREIPKNKTSLKVFPCHHVFHEDCLRPWLAQKTTCPTCRFDIDPHSVTLRRPVVRNNPLRPRGRNTAASTRATPYGSRPATPAVRTEDRERAASSAQTSVSPQAATGMDDQPAAETFPDSTASASVDNASSGSVPTFTQSDAPRSPFAFPRSTRVAQSEVDAGHMDRPPPIAGAEASGNDQDLTEGGRGGRDRRRLEDVQRQGGSDFDPAGMQEAVHMLHELLRRGHPEHGLDDNNNLTANNTTNSNDINHTSDNHIDAAAPTDGSRTGHNPSQRSASAANGDAPNDSNSSPRRHNSHSHTIAIFEIALPDMPAHMMPDAFQGANDNAPQPFGNGVFQSFMIPFGQGNNSMPINGNRVPGDNVEQDRAPANQDQHAEPSAPGDAPRSNASRVNPLVDAANAESGEGVRPIHPPSRLHRWRSDPEQRHATDSIAVSLDGPDAESADRVPAPSQQPPHMERRRGDHPWHPPHVKESFSEWIVSREKALHWRCDDPICLYAPPEHPYTELTEEEWREWKPTDEKLTKIKSYNQYRFSGEENTGLRPVCEHEFHPSCLKISCLSSNWWYKEPGRQETTVRCPKCRMQGWVRDEEMQSDEAAVLAVPASSTTS